MNENNLNGITSANKGVRNQQDHISIPLFQWLRSNWDDSLLKSQRQIIKMRSEFEMNEWINGV